MFDIILFLAIACLAYVVLVYWIHREPRQCIHCVDPEGKACFPVHGPAPRVFYSEGIEGFTPDEDDPSFGTYWCRYCGSGKDAPVLKVRSLSSMLCKR